MSKKKVVTLVTNGYASGLEESVAKELEAKHVPFQYEPQPPILYLVPEKAATHKPDFVLANGVIVESIGRFVTADRQMQLEIRKQHPLLDIRFVFSNSRGRISKQSQTTYAMWCRKYGFQYADKSIPQAWIAEVIAPERKAAAEALTRKV